MNKLFKIFFISLLAIYPNLSLAGDVMMSGSVLTEDSYVFTIDEAERLMNKMGELERTVTKQKEELNLNLQLVQVLESQVVGLNNIVELKNLQLEEYNSMNILNQKRIKKLERRNNFSTARELGLFTAGIGIAIASILIADKIDDTVEGNFPNNLSQSQAKSNPLFRF